MQFAKLFEFSDIGQVLIVRTTDPKDEGRPIIRTTIQEDTRNLPFSSVTKFDKSEDGFDDRDEIFEQLGPELAYQRGRQDMETLLTIMNPQSAPPKE